MTAINLYKNQMAPTTLIALLTLSRPIIRLLRILKWTDQRCATSYTNIFYWLRSNTIKLHD